MLRFALLVLAFAAAYVLTLVVGSVRMFSWVLELVRAYGRDIVGEDPTITLLVAIAVFALMALLPWRSLVFAPLTGSPRALASLAALAGAAAVALSVVGSSMFFGADGTPRQSVIYTPTGPVVINAPPGEIDQRTGLMRIPLTAEVLRTLNLSKNRGADPNTYFSVGDGKPKRWFVLGTCETRDFDGYDDRGRRLEPATAERIESCQKAEADAKRKQERKARTARVLALREIGHYRAVGRWATVGGLRFVLREVVVLRNETRVQFEVSDARDDAESLGLSPRFEFGIVDNQGMYTPASRVQRVQGGVGIDAMGRPVTGGPGDSGRIVVEFPRNSDAGAFGVSINRASTFNQVARHIARFSRF